MVAMNVALCATPVRYMQNAPHIMAGSGGGGGGGHRGLLAVEGGAGRLQRPPGRELHHPDRNHSPGTASLGMASLEVASETRIGRAGAARLSPGTAPCGVPQARREAGRQAGRAHAVGGAAPARGQGPAGPVQSPCRGGRCAPCGPDPPPATCSATTSALPYCAPARTFPRNADRFWATTTFRSERLPLTEVTSMAMVFHWTSIGKSPWHLTTS